MPVASNGLACNPLSYPDDVWEDPIVGALIPKGLKGNLDYRMQIILEADQKKDLRQDLMEMCSESFLFWVNTFAWTYVVKSVSDEGEEKRANLRSHPFITWPVQDGALNLLEEGVEHGRDVIIDKSRDMGASWMVTLLAEYYFLFRPDSHSLLTSRVEDLVDRQGDPDSLFWKLDFLNGHLPELDASGEEHGVSARWKI